MWLNEDIFIPTPLTYLIWGLGTLILFGLGVIVRIIIGIPLKKKEIKPYLFFSFISFGLCTSFGLLVSIPLTLLISTYIELNFMTVMYFCFFVPGLLLITHGAIQEKRENNNSKNQS